jgi:hypothetical protein
MLFLAFSYRIIFLGKFPANGKQSLSQPVVLSEVLVGNFICLSVNLSEIKGLSLKAGETVCCNGDAKNGGLDNFLLQSFGFNFQLREAETNDGLLNERSALFLP